MRRAGSKRGHRERTFQKTEQQVKDPETDVNYCFGRKEKGQIQFETGDQDEVWRERGRRGPELRAYSP